MGVMGVHTANYIVKRISFIYNLGSICESIDEELITETLITCVEIATLV